MGRLAHLAIVAAAGTCFLVSAGPAAAATARIESVPGPPNPSVVYTAEDGERNRLGITIEGQKGPVVLHDPGAEITPGPGCTRSGQRRVVCSADFLLPLVIARLGDQDDTATVSSASAFPRADVYGEDGADVLTGSEQGDLLLGGGGDDTIDGGPGHDRLHGGAGRDTLTGGDGAGVDTIEGDDPDGAAQPDVITGDGDDTVVYSGRTDPVTVDLKTGIGGADGEGDTLAGIAEVRGGAAGDRLFGSAARERLLGGRGDDILDARRGRDYLSGGSGDDAIRGGGGEDFILGGPGDDRFLGSEDRRRDRHRCGHGADWVVEQDTRDLTDRTCETAGWTATRGPARWAPIRANPVKRSRRVLEWVATCRERRCRGRILLTRPGGRVLGSGRFDVRRGEARTMQAELTRRGYKRLRRGGYFRVSIRASHARSGFTIFARRGTY